MAIKIKAKNPKYTGKVIGIEFKNGEAVVEGKDEHRAMIFAERSGLDYEEVVKEEPKKAEEKKTAKK